MVTSSSPRSAIALAFSTHGFQTTVSGRLHLATTTSTLVCAVEWSNLPRGRLQDTPVTVWFSLAALYTLQMRPMGGLG